MVFAIHQHESAIGFTCVLPILNADPNSLPTLSLCVVTEYSFHALPHVLNLHWSSVLPTIMYMFQCYFLKSSHPLLPLSPKVCSLCHKRDF